MLSLKWKCFDSLSVKKHWFIQTTQVEKKSGKRWSKNKKLPLSTKSRIKTFCTDPFDVFVFSGFNSCLLLYRLFDFKNHRLHSIISYILLYVPAYSCVLKPSDKGHLSNNFAGQCNLSPFFSINLVSSRTYVLLRG